MGQNLWFMTQKFCEVNESVMCVDLYDGCKVLYGMASCLWQGSRHVWQRSQSSATKEMAWKEVI